MSQSSWWPWNPAPCSAVLVGLNTPRGRVVDVHAHPLLWAVLTALAQGWSAHSPAWAPRPGLCTSFRRGHRVT